METNFKELARRNADALYNQLMEQANKYQDDGPPCLSLEYLKLAQQVLDQQIRLITPDELMD